MTSLCALRIDKCSFKSPNFVILMTKSFSNLICPSVVIMLLSPFASPNVSSTREPFISSRLGKAGPQVAEGADGRWINQRK